ncbi:hypothetical protein DMUE_4052 [Dictyocoela muelleri]|nr:hypothetical protein DMUE_4052 [Dictyocoela muelleri]
MKNDNNEARNIDKNDDHVNTNLNDAQNYVISNCKSYKPQNQNHISILSLCENTLADTHSECIKNIYEKVRERFQRMPRNGWNIVLEYSNKKFNQELTIEKLRKYLNLLDRGQSPILGINESTPDHTINNPHRRNAPEKLNTNMNLILSTDLKQEPLNIYSIENKKNINKTYNNQLVNTISNDIINKTGEKIENDINPILNAKDVLTINPKKHDNDNRNEISNKKEATKKNNKRNKTDSISSLQCTYKRPKRENNQKVEKIKSTKHNQDKFRTIEIQFHRIYEQISKIKMSDRHWIPKLNPYYNLEEDKNIIIAIIEEFLKI